MEKLLNCKEVALKLRIAKSTVYLWAETGHLPAVLVQKGPRRASWRFREKDIEKWLRPKFQETKDE